MLPKTICIIPWIGIEAQSLGLIRPCCIFEDVIKNSDGTDMRLTEHTLSDAFSSEYMQQIRQQFLNNEQPKQCKQCWDEEAVGRPSKRIVSTFNSPYLNRIGEIDYTVEPTKIMYIDLKLGNVCNLACRICGGWSSSKLVKEEISYLPIEEQKNHESLSFIKMGQWPREAPAFWEDLRSLIPSVKYFEITGGEPFLISHHFDVLQYAVDHGYAKDIEIHYNTNGTILPYDAINIWQHFKRVQIAFSIDNLRERYEFERKYASWADTIAVITEVNRMKALYPNIITQICITINIQNVYYLEELCEWRNNAHYFDSTYFNILHNSTELSVAYMTPEAKKLVIQKLENGKFTSSDQQHIDSIIQFIKNGAGSDGTQFCERMKYADAYRNEDFSDLYPEIAEAMGYSRNG